MEMVESLRQAGESIADHPRRVIASAMGVFWGAAAVILMLSFGSGFTEFFQIEFGKFGRPSLFVIPGLSSSGFPGYRPGVPVSFDREDALAVERATSEHVAAVLGEHMSQERLLVEVSGRVRRLDLTASDDRFAYYRKFDLAHGRFFSAGDVERHRAVAVLGYDAAEDLFGHPEDGLGRSLRVEGQPFELIGVFARKRGRQYMNTNRPDNRLLVVPLTAAESRLGMDRERLDWATVYLRPGVDSKVALREVTAALAARAGFHPDDQDALRHFDIAQILGSIDLMNVGLTLFIGIAGTITLLVGGIGIANYHLATLAERSVEIGVAKALGARNRALMAQSVLESVLVSGAAGLLGVGLGVALTQLAGAVIPPEVFPAPEVSPGAAAIAVTALVAVTSVAALVPARRVQQMDISIALREST